MSGWLLLRRWFVSKVEKSLIGKLQEEMEFSASGLRNWQTCMNELLFNWIWFEWKSTIAWLADLWANSLCQKDRTKGKTVVNYRPVSCLPLMWKVLTGVISEHLYIFFRKREYITRRGYYKILQKGCKRIAQELKIRYYWKKQYLQTAKGEVQTWQWLG